MKAKKISGTHLNTVFVKVSDTTFDVTKDAQLYGGGKGSDMKTEGRGLVEDITKDPTISGNTYIIEGSVSGTYGGVATYGDHTTIEIKSGALVRSGIIGAIAGSGAAGTAGEFSKITVDKGATMDGTIGIIVSGEHSTATNNGHIENALYGMVGATVISGTSDVDNVSITNNGFIEAFAGMSVGGVHDKAVNGAKGVIFGDAIGMADTSVTGVSSSLVNHGTIRILNQIPSFSGQGGAIVGGAGDDNVRNDGKMYGDVVLGAGDDVFNTVGGSLKGKIYGGDGSDTFVIDKAYKIVELDTDTGTDTVKSSVTYTLAANIEDLVLTGKKDINGTGNAGDNSLTGNAGNNILTGGDGVDTFHFATKGGKDTIADFVIGTDKIDLSHWTAVGDFNTVLADAKDHGDDVWIHSGKDTLIIEGHHKMDLVDTDFSF